MARLAKGKGARGRTVELLRHGALLTRDEVDGPSVMLRGYRRLGSEAAAAAALDREVAKAIGEGLAPADDEAREIAARLPAVRKKGKPELPLRQDLYVYNEATGFMVTSLRMAGKALEDGSKAWSKAVLKGDILPVGLYQDDPFVVRVVVGDELEPQEAEEWVSRIDWHLDVKDGKLCVTGGAPLVDGDYDADDSYHDQFVRTLEIPKGRYRATVYAYVPGVNGDAALDRVAGGYGQAEPTGAWFRRTRPGEAFPAWLRYRCTAEADQDPGHEKEWEALALPEDGPDYVDFLIHLVPVDALPTEGLVVPEGGWFAEAMSARCPDRCPLGLEGRDVVGHLDESSSGWIYAQDVLGQADALEPKAIAGGPVEVPLEHLERVYRLAWFCSRMAYPAMRAVATDGVTLDLEGDWPEGMIAAPIDGQAHLLFSNDLIPTDTLPVFAALGEHLAALPDGTVLELAAMTPEGMGMDDGEAGRHRYVGTVRSGVWRLTKAYPRVIGSKLKAALDLAAEVEDGRRLSVADDEEGARILKKAKENFGLYLGDNPASVVKGAIELGEEDARTLAMYGVAAFLERFADTWPAVDLSDEDDGESDEEDEGHPWDIDEPIKGIEVFAAPSGRKYFQSMALVWKESMADQIKAEEPKLRGSKYRHVGDVVCDQFPNVVVHAWAQPEGATFASFLLAAPNMVRFELSSRWADGASLLTSREPDLADDAEGRTYRQGFPGVNIMELMGHHTIRLAELEAVHGPPLKIEHRVGSVAEAIEAALVKQLGT